MNIPSKLIIVGSLPSPIGGVSTYCERLSWKKLAQGNDILFLDLYDGNKSSNLLNEPRFHYVNLFKYNKLTSILLLTIFMFLYGNRKVFFNFSTPKSISLVIFLSMIIRIRSGETNLTLHHGNLKLSGVWSKFARKFNFCINSVFYLNDNQKKFFNMLGFDNKLIKQEMYFPPIYKGNFIVRGLHPRNVLVSGSEEEYYNVINTLSSLIDFSEVNRITMHISVVIYGRYGQCFIDKINCLELTSRSNEFSYVTIYQNLKENEFIHLLSNQDVYIRNNSVDSFGIVVADAVNLGVKVLASDVCERYRGTIVFEYIDHRSFLKKFSLFFNTST